MKNYINEDVEFKNMEIDRKCKNCKNPFIKWHDLRKNPDDLPIDNRLVLVVIDYLALGREYAIRENLKDDYKGVIAWCEIPQFEGE